MNVLRILILCLLCSGSIQGRNSLTDEDPVIDLTFPAAFSANINTIYIPFQLVGRLMVVEAAIDTVRGNFIVDTGSERLLLNKNYFSGEGRDVAVTSVSNTGLVDAREKIIDKLQLSQLQVPRLVAHIVDLSHIEFKKNTRIMGILGYNVFKEFEVMIDFQNMLVVLSRVDKSGQRLDTIPYYERPNDSLRFEHHRHLIVVEVIINGVKSKMFLDSGAELNLIDRRIGRKVLDKFKIIKRVNLVGVGKHQVEVIAGIIEEAMCGNQKGINMNTLLTSLDEINEKMGVRVEGVLGYEFLHTRRTLINYQKQKLYFYAYQRS